MAPSHHSDLIHRSDLHARGVADGEVRSAVRSGAITPIRRGVYIDTATARQADARTRLLWSIHAAVASAPSDLVVSHASAAVMHDLAQWGSTDDRVHLTANRQGGGRSTAQRMVHASPLHPDDVVDVDGIRVTSIARTVVDTACSQSFESAVCTADSALQRIPREAVVVVLDRSRGRRNIDRARRVVAFSDGRAATPGESRSRVYLQRNGFPTPSLQCELFDERGRFVARPDFLLDGVVGEFDGLSKYREYGDAAEAVTEEKLREDLLRSHGWQVVRWTWGELTTPEPAVRIRRALALARTLPAPTTIDRSALRSVLGPGPERTAGE